MASAVKIDPKLWTVSPVTSAIIGLCFNAALALVVGTLLYVFLYLYFSVPLTYVVAATAAILVVQIQFLFIGVFETVNTAYSGVFKILGKRVTWLISTEGEIWTLPYFNLFTLEKVDMHLESEEISTLSKKQGVHAASGIMSNNNIEMQVDTGIQFRPFNPIKYLNLGAKEEIIFSLRDLILSIARDVANDMTDEDFQLAGTELQDKIINGYEKDVIVNGQKVNTITIKGAKQKATEDWGIDIDALNVKRIAPVNDLVKAANARLAIEEREAKADNVETQNLIRNTQLIAGSFSMSPADAVKLFQTERGKRTVSDINVTGDNTGLVAPAAMLRNVIQGNTPQPAQQSQPASQPAGPAVNQPQQQGGQSAAGGQQPQTP